MAQQELQDMQQSNADCCSWDEPAPVLGWLVGIHWLRGGKKCWESWVALGQQSA